MQRLIPYTVTNFKDITEQYYYVDKTMYLPKLEKYRHPVFLRPRRFGKSLFTEMLRYYYDIKYAGEFEQIFGKLWIGKNPTPNRNKYFFLKLSFSGMGTYAKEDERIIRDMFSNHLMVSFVSFLNWYADFLEVDKKFILAFESNYKTNAATGIKKLAELVHSKGGKMFIAIDEYDSLTNAMALFYQYAPKDEHPYLDVLKSSGFFRAFFETLKDNEQTGIERVYITGILPITIADMNSGYNVAEWLTFRKDFVNMLGITASEIDILLDEIYSENPTLSINKSDVKEIITKYYNGYRFSSQSEAVYNPSMTMYALQHLVNEGTMPSNLVDSNLRIDYNQISYLFGRNTQSRDEIIADITDNQEMFFSSDLAVSFNMEDYREGRYISEGLYFSGILTMTENRYILKIPNIVTYDMAISYFERVQNYRTTSYEQGKWIRQYTQNGDVEDLVAQFFENVIQKFPGEFFSNANESFYHGLLFHILFNSMAKDQYEVLPEYNLPQGRADIMCRTLPGAKVTAEFNDLFEFKQVAKGKSDAELQAKFIEAKEQLDRYAEKGWRGVAVCFRGNKDFLIKVRQF